MTIKAPVNLNRTLRLGGALAGLSIALGACNTITGTTGELTAGIPTDYRQRHPIAIQEANRSVVIFIGQARGGLSASQRADVMGLAQTWLHEATGAIESLWRINSPGLWAIVSILVIGAFNLEEYAADSKTICKRM